MVKKLIYSTLAYKGYDKKGQSSKRIYFQSGQILFLAIRTIES
jgi:hypothetical protein